MKKNYVVYWKENDTVKFAEYVRMDSAQWRFYDELQKGRKKVLLVDAKTHKIIMKQENVSRGF